MTQTEKRIAIAKDRGLNPQNWPLYGLSGKLEDNWCLGCDIDKLIPIPDYFTDPAAAVELLEALRREHGGVVTLAPTDSGWKVLVTLNVFITHECGAPTFPAAVAEAYGRARNLWSEAQLPVSSSPLEKTPSSAKE